MELAFAGLHQLCVPLLNRLDGLPEPQRGGEGRLVPDGEVPHVMVGVDDGHSCQTAGRPASPPAAE